MLRYGRELLVIAQRIDVAHAVNLPTTAAVSDGWAHEQYHGHRAQDLYRHSSRVVRFLISTDNSAAADEPWDNGVVAMNVYEFARMISASTGLEVRGFQGFHERPEEKAKMESILEEHGKALEIEHLLSGELKPDGVLILYLNPDSGTTSLYELSAEVSKKWRELPKSTPASVN